MELIPTKPTKTNFDKYATIGNKTIFEKKVPQTTKYSSIKTTLNTDYSYLKTLGDKLISKRKSELFKRVKSSYLVGLLKQERNFESIYNLTQKDSKNQIVKIVENEKSDTQENSLFLLLDIRESDNFSVFHIREAVNFPASHFNRDKFPTDLLNYKNKENKMIIIYGLDEKEGIPVAHLLYQKGINNVFLLTGGIEEFCNEFSEEIIGKIPEKLHKSDKTTRILVRSNKENNCEIKPKTVSKTKKI